MPLEKKKKLWQTSKLQNSFQTADIRCPTAKKPINVVQKHASPQTTKVVCGYDIVLSCEVR